MEFTLSPLGSRTKVLGRSWPACDAVLFQVLADFGTDFPETRPDLLPVLLSWRTAVLDALANPLKAHLVPDWLRDAAVKSDRMDKAWAELEASLPADRLEYRAVVPVQAAELEQWLLHLTDMPVGFGPRAGGPGYRTPENVPGALAPLGEGRAVFLAYGEAIDLQPGHRAVRFVSVRADEAAPGRRDALGLKECRPPLPEVGRVNMRRAMEAINMTLIPFGYGVLLELVPAGSSTEVHCTSDAWWRDFVANAGTRMTEVWPTTRLLPGWPAAGAPGPTADTPTNFASGHIATGTSPAPTDPDLITIERWRLDSMLRLAERVASVTVPTSAAASPAPAPAPGGGGGKRKHKPATIDKWAQRVARFEELTGHCDVKPGDAFGMMADEGLPVGDTSTFYKMQKDPEVRAAIKANKRKRQEPG